MRYINDYPMATMQISAGKALQAFDIFVGIAGGLGRMAASHRLRRIWIRVPPRPICSPFGPRLLPCNWGEHRMRIFDTLDRRPPCHSRSPVRRYCAAGPAAASFDQFPGFRRHAARPLSRPFRQGWPRMNERQPARFALRGFLCRVLPSGWYAALLFPRARHVPHPEVRWPHRVIWAFALALGWFSGWFARQMRLAIPHPAMWAWPACVTLIR